MISNCIFELLKYSSKLFMFVLQDQRILELMLAKREGEKRLQQKAKERDTASNGHSNGDDKAADLATRLSMDTKRRRSCSETRTSRDGSKVNTICINLKLCIIVVMYYGFGVWLLIVGYFMTWIIAV